MPEQIHQPKKTRWQDVLLVLLLLIAVLGGALVWLLRANATQHLVAEINGPDGSKQYGLWYARNGDLTFGPLNFWGGHITYRDYYGDLTIVQTQWVSDDHVVLTLKNGTEMNLCARFDVQYR